MNRLRGEMGIAATVTQGDVLCTFRCTLETHLAGELIGNKATVAANSALGAQTGARGDIANRFTITYS